ncbi:protein of unknown function [Methanoculleus bourgensis]|uniref:Uncharacterized protein n=1 Tax=Methanoculleus bourgensis TaxID=83986 RepID=A0A0X3BLS0_9EURY|nr:protein of unknown function [Methanoculleus bourgensis]
MAVSGSVINWPSRDSNCAKLGDFRTNAGQPLSGCTCPNPPPGGMPFTPDPPVQPEC